MPTARYSDLLDARFHDLLISYDFARNNNGVGSHILESIHNQTLEEDTRQLLEVEETAQQERESALADKQTNQNNKSISLNQKVIEIVETQLQDTNEIYTEVLQIQDSVIAILDLLSVRSASIARVEPLVNNLPWLGSEIIKFVNLPVYKKANSKVKLDKVRTALGYIGIENLNYIIPTFAFKKWIPHSTEPFRLMKRKLWESGMGAAICCQKLAAMQGLPENAAFCAGMFHGLGQSAIVRLYLRAFDQEWKAQLTTARESRDKENHDALVDLEPDGATLCNLMSKHAIQLSANLASQFNLKRLIFADALNQYAHETDMKAYEPMTKIIAQGVCYSRYKMLQKHSLIAKHEAKIYYKEHLLKSTDISELNKLSLLRLNLRL